MIKNENQFKSRSEKLKANAKKVKRICGYPDCTDEAIDSHLLQRNGVLKQLSAGQNVLYELNDHVFDKKLLKFKLTGISNTLSFYGFCNHHDNSVFKRVETAPVDYNDYQVQMLMSFKAFVNEIRKKEVVIDWYNRILVSNEIRDYKPQDYLEQIAATKKQFELGLADGEALKECFYNELRNHSNPQQFLFFTREVRRVELTASGVFTFETSQEIFIKAKLSPEEVALSDVFFHFIPLQEKNIVIIGCLKKSSPECLEFVSGFLQGTDDEVLKKISDTLILQIENWLMSIEFYKKHIQERENLIIDYILAGHEHFHERDSATLNLFDAYF